MEDQLVDLSRHLGDTIRSHRTARGMSLGDLARASGLSKTILARIEGGAGNPSVETLWRLSRALHVPLGALVAEPEAARTRVVRARSGEELRADSGMGAWLVHAEGQERRIEVFDIELPRGTDHETGPHLPGTEEVVLCVSGRVAVGPLGEEVGLGPGDAVVFTADVGHRYHALRDTRTVCCMLYPAAR
ncbi:MAG: helix-turn-helix domain-containing protein [Solirubrobacterales bacterium]|nr:helix-turn-helix domain-containing protein [Solirubrobacterales bacterium]